MFENKMVCCLKAGGKILREAKDTVFIPFGSEYSILLKNLNSKRAIVNITIDGVDVAPSGLVINANSEVDLERFIKDHSQGNRFKFIERTAAIENGPRGIKADDGLIRVSFKYEKIYQNSNTLWNSTTLQYPPGVRGFGQSKGWPETYPGADVYGMSNVSNASFNEGLTRSVGAITKSATKSASRITASSAISDVGITVPGSISNQRFSTVSTFATEPEEFVIVLRILGETDQGTPVVEPVTVKTKPTCVTCGKVNKATSKFCTECGTSLVIV